ncbi:sulfatase-like hydrolase/transferase [Rheinheimera sp. EpRS3]|uniref:sulfatase-like hydrolase/transferase n=1 Tax=Rheinheimera sp. EpRS3 TaxID=1712383 RepID=UPI00074B2736|nr:sulfatase-like hydrolase/transferase [Rheinheimera sp. EpRS3]KUM53309.1 hypothetical protein AR688_05160 [Rheinheimera sp. EpRS3]
MHNLRIKYLKPIFYLLILPNVFLFSVAAYLNLGRSPVNIDYLFAALFVYSRVPIIGYVAFAVFLLLDVLALVVQVFQFARLDHLMYLSSFLPEAPVAYQIATACTVLWLIFFMFYAVTLRKNTNLTQALALFNIALGIYTIGVYSAPADNTERIWRIDNAAFVGSPTLHTVKHRTRLFHQYFYADGEAFSKYIPPSATSENASTFGYNDDEKLLLIINESWGVTANPGITEQLLQSVVHLNEHVTEIDSGQINFTGATVAGELRELCQLSPNHFNLKDVTAGFENCLPNKLKQRGYTTSAFHAASGVMYDRIYWYSQAGFQNSNFFENFEWSRRCYSYPGGCDFELINKVVEELANPGKRFAYWLTLNSHAIYDERDLITNQFDCQRFAVDPSTQSCRNLKLQAQFFYVLAQQIAEHKLQGVRVIVVSDHAPVITDKKEKNTYFVDNRINWVSFKVAAY